MNIYYILRTSKACLLPSYFLGAHWFFPHSPQHSVTNRNQRPMDGKKAQVGKAKSLRFFFFFLLERTIFKVFLEVVTILLLFYVLVLWCEACGILAPWPGIKLTLPALEGEVLTTGPPGKSQSQVSKRVHRCEDSACYWVERQSCLGFSVLGAFWRWFQQMFFSPAIT